MWGDHNPEYKSVLDDNDIDDEYESVVFDDNDLEDEYARFLREGRDIDLLEDFFQRNWNDVEFGFHRAKANDLFEAIERTVVDVVDINDIIRRSEAGEECDLSQFFRPLDNTEYRNAYRLSKGYQGGSWVRLYAVRLQPNLFVISGWSIKLTKNNNDRDHTKHEIVKIGMVNAFLEENCLEYSEDFEK